MNEAGYSASMPHADDQRLAGEAAGVIAATYQSYLDRFRDLTQHARGNFENCDWHALQHDSARRLDLYNDAVQEGLRRLWSLLGPRVADGPTWAALRPQDSRVPNATARLGGAFTRQYRLEGRCMFTLHPNGAPNALPNDHRAPPSDRSIDFR